MKVVTLSSNNRKPRRRRSDRRLGSRTTTMHSAATAARPRRTRVSKAKKAVMPQWMVRLTGGTMLVVCLTALFFLFQRDTFYVYDASVSGNHLLTAAEIYAAAGVDSLSVFWINPDDVRQNVEALSNIKSAQVKITLPANVSINIEEREPELVWQTGNATWWIDSEGTFIEPRPEMGEPNNKLRLIDGEARPVTADTKIDIHIVRGAQAVHQSRPELSELMYTQAYGLSYISPEGWPIYLGDDQNIAAKLAAAKAVRADLLARNVVVNHIDARNPMRVVYQEIVAGQ